MGAAGAAMGAAVVLVPVTGMRKGLRLGHWTGVLMALLMVDPRVDGATMGAEGRNMAMCAPCMCAGVRLNAPHNRESAIISPRERGFFFCVFFALDFAPDTGISMGLDYFFSLLHRLTKGRDRR